MERRFFIGAMASLIGAVSVSDSLASSSQAAGQAARVKIAPIGDSRTAIVTFDLNRIQGASQCHYNWANMLHRQRFPLSGVFATSGFTSTQALDWLPSALGSGAAFLSILLGLNDVGAGLPVSQTVANITYMIAQAQAAGMRVFLFTDPGNQAMTTSQTANFHGTGGLNDQLRAIAAASGGHVILVDWVPVLLSSTNPITFRSGYSYDGVHLDIPGAIAGGDFFASIAGPYMPTEADPAPEGNLVTNADFATATGGSPGAGNSGVLPYKFSGSVDNANCSAVFALNTRSDGLKEIVAAVTTANAATTLGGIRVNQALPIAQFPKSGRFLVGCQIDVDAGYANLADVGCQLDYNYSDGTFAQAFQARSSSGKRVIPSTGARTLTMESLPNLVSDTKTLTSATLRMTARCLGAGTATVRMRRPWVVPA